MAKLNQILAIEKGSKSNIYSFITGRHKTFQKPDLFNGFSKDYHKVDTSGEDLPSEKKKVQNSVNDLLQEVSKTWTELMDLTARKDWTNCHAAADIKINGRVLIAKVPVTYLLFLEKQLTDLRTMVNALPILDENEDWHYDQNSGLWKSEVVKTHRTKKEQVPIVLYDATAVHPAQTQLITRDVLAGHWHMIKISGAMPKPLKQQICDRLEKLLHAVKQAREEANGIDEVNAPSIGSILFDYVLSS